MLNSVHWIKMIRLMRKIVYLDIAGVDVIYPVLFD